jgi:tetratricopeptide (TPR) repeat protein
MHNKTPVAGSAMNTFRKPYVWGITLFGAAFCFATLLAPACAELAALRLQSDDPLAALMGDSRKLFANHFYIKADAYFHSGFYPTIFDNRESHQTPHMAEDAGVNQSRNTGDETRFLGEAASWIDAHGRKHFPSVHTHLGENSPDAHKHVEREILPWLKFSSQLDPNKIDSYTVAAYWLRRTGNPREAERFLRDGLELNPQSVEILFELGRCRFDARDFDRARNLWEVAWKRWLEQNINKPPDDQDRFLAGQILIHLAVLESHAGNNARSVSWLETLIPFKENPAEIRKRIDEVKAGETLKATLLESPTLTQPAN